MMTPEEMVNPHDAPWTINTVHRGLNVLLDGTQVLALEAKYPSPPYGENGVVFYDTATGDQVFPAAP